MAQSYFCRIISVKASSIAELDASLVIAVLNSTEIPWTHDVNERDTRYISFFADNAKDQRRAKAALEKHLNLRSINCKYAWL